LILEGELNVKLKGKYFSNSILKIFLNDTAVDADAAILAES